MPVKDITPTYIHGTPISIELVNIRHICPHRHCDSIEILYCLRGTLTMTIAHEELCLAPGEIVTVDHDDIHYVTANTDNAVIILHINMKDINRNWQDIQYIFFSCATALCKPHQQKPMHDIYDIILTLAYTYYSQINSANENRQKEIRHMSIRLVNLLLEKFSWFSVEGFTAEENEKYRSRLNDISAYLQQNYQNKITIPQVAQKIHIDENYLSQFLKRTSFISFTSMVNYIRSYEAEKLLLFTGKSIHEISDLCGFSSVKYFHKYFKIVYSTTPLQHRIKYLNIAAIPQNICSYETTESLKMIKDEIIRRYIDENTHFK